MKPRQPPPLEVFAARAYPGDWDRLRLLRDEMQTKHPDHVVRMADVIRLAVGSASAAIALMEGKTRSE